MGSSGGIAGSISDIWSEGRTCTRCSMGAMGGRRRSCGFKSCQRSESSLKIILRSIGVFENIGLVAQPDRAADF